MEYYLKKLGVKMLDIFDKFDVSTAPKQDFTNFKELHFKLSKGNGTWKEVQEYRRINFSMTDKERAIFLSEISPLAKYVIQQFGGVDNVEIKGSY